MKSLNFLLAACLFLLSSSVLAHTGIQSSSPSNGAKLSQPPETIDLSFKGLVRLLKVEVKDSTGDSIDIPLEPDAEPSKDFSLPLPDIKASAYQVNWTIAGADGHKIKGKFAFKYLGPNGVADETDTTDQAFSESILSGWVLSTILNKLLLYIALAMTVGGLAAMFTLSGYKAFQNSFITYLLPGCLLGLFAASLGFFLQVGSFAEMGIAGMWNLDYLPILWDSGAGQSYRLQLLGWLLVMTSAAIIWAKPHISPIISAIAFIGVLIIVRPGAEGFNAYSFWALAAVVFIVMRDLATKKVSNAVPSIYVALLTSIFLTLTAGVLLPTSGWQPVQAISLGYLTGAGCFVMVGYLSVIIAMRRGETAFVSPFRYTILLWAILLGIVVFGDIPDFWTIVGSIILVITGVYTFYRENKLKKRAEAQGGQDTKSPQDDDDAEQTIWPEKIKDLEKAEELINR